MRPRLALSIMAVFWLVAGLVGLVAPVPYLSSFGLEAPPEAVIAVRDGGVVLVGVAMINWLARDAVGRPLRGLLWGNVFILVADAALNVWEMAAGIAPVGPGVATFGVTALLVIMLALGMRAARTPDPGPEATGTVSSRRQ